MTATMSLLGLYRWDNTLFDDLTIPAALDKDTLVNALLMDTAELESLYTDFDALKTMLGYWSARQMPTWQRVTDACSAVYDPLRNYDRHEDIELKETRDLAGSTDTEGDTSGDGSSTLSTAAFNSSTLQTGEKTENESGTEYSSSVDTTDTGTITHETDAHIYGNIGVTTSQQMLREELDLAEYANAYNYIIKDIRDRFCILVY